MIKKTKFIIPILLGFLLLVIKMLPGTAEPLQLQPTKKERPAVQVRTQALTLTMKTRDVRITTEKLTVTTKSEGVRILTQKLTVTLKPKPKRRME